MNINHGIRVETRAIDLVDLFLFTLLNPCLDSLSMISLHAVVGPSFDFMCLLVLIHDADGQSKLDQQS